MKENIKSQKFLEKKKKGKNSRILSREAIGKKYNIRDISLRNS